MSRNLPGTPSYALPDRAPVGEPQRKRPRGAICLPPELWLWLREEADRRDEARVDGRRWSVSALLEDAARTLQEKSTAP